MYQTLFNLFNKASETLKYPKIRFVAANGDKVQLYLATKKYIAIKVNGEYCGKIMTPNSDFIFYVKDYNLKQEIHEFMVSPISEAKIKGQAFNHCCFCGIELNNAISVANGYGPICAEKYGLPWEALPEESISTDDF